MNPATVPHPRLAGNSPGVEHRLGGPTVGSPARRMRLPKSLLYCNRCSMTIHLPLEGGAGRPREPTARARCRRRGDRSLLEHRCRGADDPLTRFPALSNATTAVPAPPSPAAGLSHQGARFHADCQGSWPASSRSRGPTSNLSLRSSAMCISLSCRRRRAPSGVRCRRTIRWSSGSASRATRPAVAARSTSSTALWCRRSNDAAMSPIVAAAGPGCPRIASSSWCCAGGIPRPRACCSLHRVKRRMAVRKARSSW
jgi:hypothetical protein